MWDGLRDFMGDLRRAARSLRKSPAVLLITVISLGIGIGAMTSVFSVANSFLFRGSVGINDPETLVAIYTTGDGGGAYGASSLPDYLDLLQGAPALEDATLIDMRTVSLGRPDEAVALLAEEVTGNYFEVTGIRPVISRSFLSEESVIGSSARVAMIGHDRWQNDFDGQLDVLGSEIRINGYRHTIVGVVPDGVLSRIMPLEPDVWVPFNSVGLEASTKAALIGQRGHRSYRILGRLAPGSSREALESQLGVLSSRLLAQYPEEWVDDTGNPRSFVLLDEAESRLGANAKLLIGGIAAFFFVAVGLILLIACANVTTLFLARAANRNREMAVRVSLGASRYRLVIMFLTEGLIPGLGAGLLGLAVASGINHAMNMAIASAPFGLPLRFSFGIDGRVMAVAMLLSLGSSLVFGLVPALEGSRLNLVPSLKGDGGGASRSGGLKLRNILVATQCVASVILLVGASLFVRALSKASETDFGLDPTRIAITTKKLDAEGFSEVEGRQYIRDLQATLVARPDVEVAHVSRTMEMTLLSLNPTLAVDVEAAGYVPVDREKEQFWRNSVTPGYLDMLGVQILRGRGLDATDVAGAPLAAVVNETFAERLWPGQASVLKWGGLFGLFLAVIGIYGIVSFAVTQKTREVAIRIALGAERRQVLARVVRDGIAAGPGRTRRAGAGRVRGRASPDQRPVRHQPHGPSRLPGRHRAARPRGACGQRHSGEGRARNIADGGAPRGVNHGSIAWRLHGDGHVGG
jgi:predicted permease